MKIFNRISAILVLSGALISAPTLAEPNGALKKMLDFEITLLEYIELHTKLHSVERLALGDVTVLDQYNFGLVRLSATFDFDENELIFNLNPTNRESFSSIADAKSYCRNLITAEQFEVWFLLMDKTSPNGWSRGSVGSEEHLEELYKSSKLRHMIWKRQIEEELPERVSYLECKASLDKDGELKSFSYNM